jgi:hypothetical protein
MLFPMWVAAPSFLQDAIEQLLRSSLGPWLAFAAHTGLSVAALVFIFVLLITLLFSLLLLCAGDPKGTLATVLFLGPVAAFYAALHVGALVALFGWPILWVLQHAFGVSLSATTWVSRILSFNFASVGLIGASALALVILSMGKGVWTQQQGLRAVRSDARINHPASPGRDRMNQVVVSKKESFVRAGYHRIAVVAAPLFAAPVLLLGIIVASEQQSVWPLACFLPSAAAVFAITYGIGHVLGSLVDTFICQMHSADHAQ